MTVHFHLNEENPSQKISKVNWVFEVLLKREKYQEIKIQEKV